MKVEFHYNTFLEGLLSLQDLMIPKNTPQFIYEMKISIYMVTSWLRECKKEEDFARNLFKTGVIYWN